MTQPESVPTSLQQRSKPGRWLGRGLILGVRCYQICLSPLLGKNCRYTPTCSSYFIQAVEKYGPWRGSWKGVCRICRCHPWGGCGHDPP